MDSHELSRQVAKRRRDLDLSQEALAQRSNVSRTYISLIERGEASNISTTILSRLATALETTPEELLGRSSQIETLIPPELRTFGLEEGLDFETVDRLARLPRRGREPQTVEDWRKLYEAIREYLEEDD